MHQCALSSARYDVPAAIRDGSASHTAAGQWRGTHADITPVKNLDIVVINDTSAPAEAVELPGTTGGQAMLV